LWTTSNCYLHTSERATPICVCTSQSVLRVAGDFKRAEPDVSELALLFRALRDFNIPKARVRHRQRGKLLKVAELAAGSAIARVRHSRARAMCAILGWRGEETTATRRGEDRRG
jgi:hypothetical protein